MSFTLDHNDIDQTNDDTDSLYIVISDEPLHQSQPAQLLTKDKLTPPYTLSSWKCKKEKQAEVKANTANFYINKAELGQKFACKTFKR